MNVDNPTSLDYQLNEAMSQNDYEVYYKIYGMVRLKHLIYNRMYSFE